MKLNLVELGSGFYLRLEPESLQEVTQLARLTQMSVNSKVDISTQFYSAAGIEANIFFRKNKNKNWCIIKNK